MWLVFVWDLIFVFKAIIKIIWEGSTQGSNSQNIPLDLRNSSLMKTEFTMLLNKMNMSLIFKGAWRTSVPYVLNGILFYYIVNELTGKT